MAEAPAVCNRNFLHYAINLHMQNII